MIVRKFWESAFIPEHSTNKEILTVPADAPTVGELFEKAARGEDISEYDYESDDLSEHDESYTQDILYSDEYNDPLLRKTLLVDLHDTVKKEANNKRARNSRKRTQSKKYSNEGEEITNGDDPDNKSVQSDKE